GKILEIRNLRITQLLILTQHQDLAFGVVQLLERLTGPEHGIGRLSCSRLRSLFPLRRVLCALAAFRRQQVHRDTVKVSAKERAGRVTIGATDHGQESFLCQIFGALVAIQPPAKEAVKRTVIARKQLLKRRVRSALELEHQSFVADGSYFSQVGSHIPLDLQPLKSLS